MRMRSLADIGYHYLPRLSFQWNLCDEGRLVDSVAMTLNRKHEGGTYLNGDFLMRRGECLKEKARLDNCRQLCLLSPEISSYLGLSTSNRNATVLHKNNRSLSQESNAQEKKIKLRNVNQIEQNPDQTSVNVGAARAPGDDKHGQLQDVPS